MKYRTTLLLAAALLVPVSAQAQKRPANNSHTRSADVYLDQARNAQVAADRRAALEKAITAATEGTKTDPSNPKPWYQLGVAFVGLGDLARADSAFDRAEQIYPEYAAEIEPHRENAWITGYNTGVQALQAGDYAAAIAAFDEANAIFSGRPEALLMLGRLYIQENDAAQAERALTQALTVLRGPRRDRLSAEEKASWAEDEADAALRLSTLLADQGRNDEAVRLYRDLLAAQPDNVRARANLAAVLARTGQTEEATRIYRELIASDGLPEVTLFNAGVGLFRAEQYEHAATAFRRAAEANPHSHDLLYNLAQALLARAGQLERDGNAAATRELYQELRAVAGRLQTLDPANRNVLMMLAQAQRSLAELEGETPQAEQLRQQVVATLEKAEALQFEVTEITSVAGASDVEISGRVTNLKGTAGATVQLRFALVDARGADLATNAVSVNLPAAGESTRFSLRLPAADGGVAWKYSIGQ